MKIDKVKEFEIKSQIEDIFLGFKDEGYTVEVIDYDGGGYGKPYWYINCNGSIKRSGAIPKCLSWISSEIEDVLSKLGDYGDCHVNSFRFTDEVDEDSDINYQYYFISLTIIINKDMSVEGPKVIKKV